MHIIGTKDSRRMVCNAGSETATRIRLPQFKNIIEHILSMFSMLDVSKSGRSHWAGIGNASRLKEAKVADPVEEKQRRSRLT